MKRENSIEYGIVSRGIFVALMSIAPVVLLLRPDLFLKYLFLLAFLALGLRFVLEKTGLYRLWNDVGASAERKWDRKFLEERAKEIEREQALKKIHKSHYRDPRLPKNW